MTIVLPPDFLWITPSAGFCAQQDESHKRRKE